jgi:hypothetical protein
MALSPNFNINGLNLDYPKIRTSERGGILSMVQVSGMWLAENVADPSGMRPIGIQLNDVENINFERQYFPTLRRVDQPHAIVGVATDGDFETNWLHIVGTVRPGMPAYLGPSGTITNISTLGNVQVGYFRSAVKPSPGVVIYEGGGFSTSYMDYYTKQIVVENDPTLRVVIGTPGFAVVRLDQSIIMRSQRDLGI